MVRYFLNLSGDKINNSHQVSIIRQYAQVLFNSVVHDKVFLLPLWIPIMKVSKNNLFDQLNLSEIIILF